MLSTTAPQRRQDSGDAQGVPCAAQPCPVVLSFDIEEHYRIEAAAGVTIEPAMKAHCCERLELSTRWLLEQLQAANVKATFFIVGEIAEHNPALVRDIHRDGHEVASHGWDHRRVLCMTPESFRADVLKSKEVLEQLTGSRVVGFRAPTFSIVRDTAWALDVLVELGMRYDSSIYPVRHDRYGVPSAPRGPFRARGRDHEILELPPATLRILGLNAPMGGGGYFRLFPLLFTRWALQQMERVGHPAAPVLYFHPWEFDPEQERLPLSRFSKFRTYVGISRTRERLGALLRQCRFTRGMDAAQRLDGAEIHLPSFAVAGQQARLPEVVL